MLYHITMDIGLHREEGLYSKLVIAVQYVIFFLSSTPLHWVCQLPDANSVVDGLLMSCSLLFPLIFRYPHRTLRLW